MLLTYIQCCGCLKFSVPLVSPLADACLGLLHERSHERRLLTLQTDRSRGETHLQKYRLHLVIRRSPEVEGLSKCQKTSLHSAAFVRGLTPRFVLDSAHASCGAHYLIAGGLIGQRGVEQVLLTCASTVFLPFADACDICFCAFE